MAQLNRVHRADYLMEASHYAGTVTDQVKAGGIAIAFRKGFPPQGFDEGTAEEVVKGRLLLITLRDRWRDQ